MTRLPMQLPRTSHPVFSLYLCQLDLVIIRNGQRIHRPFRRLGKLTCVSADILPGRRDRLRLRYCRGAWPCLCLYRSSHGNLVRALIAAKEMSRQLDEAFAGCFAGQSGLYGRFSGKIWVVAKQSNSI